MIYKKGVIFILIIILLSYNCYSLGDSTELTMEENSQTLTTESIPKTTVQDSSIYNQETNTYTISQETFQTDVPSDTQIQTVEGNIFGVEITNALFSLGSLIQGSFISISNNNNVYLKSLFDNSQFTATMNEDGQLEVAQINKLGETGKVYIEISNGNLTQDDQLTFIPTGENPTYIYYNTTEIEFKDGNLSYQGELITNNIESSKVEFNNEGFTKIQLQPKEIYQNFDYKITNLEKTSVYICKNNPLCNINIDGSKFTINGKANLTYKDEVIYTSYDENNIFIIDTSTGNAELTNAKLGMELAEICSGFHYLEQEKIDLYDHIKNPPCPSIINEYTYGNINLTIQNGILKAFNLEILPPEELDNFVQELKEYERE